MIKFKLTFWYFLKKVFLLFFIPVVVSFALLNIFAIASEKKYSNDPSKVYELTNRLGLVVDLVHSQYYKEIPKEKIMEYAIKGVLENLDPHSMYFNEADAKEFEMQISGVFGGLGITVFKPSRVGFVKIMSVLPNTPAKKAGLEVEDYVMKVDNQKVDNLSLQEVVKKMRGKIGTKVTLTIMRGSVIPPFDVTIKRAEIRGAPVTKKIKNNVGIVIIPSFDSKINKETVNAINHIKKQLGKNMKGLILDLRGNPGGLLDDAIFISDLFLENGEVVSVRPRETKHTQRYNAKAGDILKGLPMVVLIDGGSASAAEIVSGALQDHSRALIVGEKSYGKGTVQRSYVVGKNHEQVKLTVARFFTASGKLINGNGITPDIYVTREGKSCKKCSDTQLQELQISNAGYVYKKYVEYRKNPNEKNREDRQMDFAIELLNHKKDEPKK